MTGSTALVVAAVSTLTASLIGAGPAPAAPPAGVECGWRITASHVLAELDGDTSERAEDLRRALTDVGADKAGFVPAGCYENANGGTPAPGDTTAPDDTTGPGRPGTSGDSNNSGNSGGSTDPAAPAIPGGGTGSDGQCTTTAANRHGWGAPAQEDGFDGTAVADGWNMYDGPGHAGNGRRTPDAISVADGQLTITGSENGDAGGMAWTGSQQFGRWEGCVRSPAPAADSLHTLLLLWPSAEDWPVGGEVDFMEISDSARQSVEGFLHYGQDNSQTQGSVEVDASEWHAFAVEWTPEQITYLVDGEPWFTDSDPAHNPPGPMHLTIQLDYFGGDASGGAEMNVDWVRQWPMEGARIEATVGADGASVGIGGNASAGDRSSTGRSGSTGGSDGGSGNGSDRSSGDGPRAESGGSDNSTDSDSSGDSDDDTGGDDRAGS